MVRIKLEDSFIELIFKEGGDVLEPTMSYIAWNLITQSFISTYIVDILSHVFTSKEPTVIWCTGLVKEDLGVVLEELHGTELSRVLLRVFRFHKLVLDKMVVHVPFWICELSQWRM